jgi:hypothetical protein
MRELLSIGEADLEPILRTQVGTNVFEETLNRIESDNELARALSRYVHFNSAFAGGVANLAGELASRQDLFRDFDEVSNVVGDRSSEVAADIFFAAVEELGGHYPQRTTHRTLAQATLIAIREFFGLSPAEIDHYITCSESTVSAVASVRDGYGVNKQLCERELFSAIGFHIGSEMLADLEFNVLNTFLRTKYSSLVDYLERSIVFINGEECPGYCWVQIHTSVEASHFRAAVHSANLALRYYAGNHTQATVKAWILDGFKEFAVVQTEFMQKICGTASDGLSRRKLVHFH